MSLIGIIQWALFWLVVAGIAALTLVSLYNNNRLLFRCLLAVVLAYIMTGTGIYVAGIIIKSRPREVRIPLVMVKAPDEKKEEKKKDEIKPFFQPLGQVTGRRDVTKVQRGKRTAKSTDRKYSNTITSGKDAAGGLATDPDRGALTGPGNSLDPADVGKYASKDVWGDPDGDPNGGIPAGFPDGKIGGRVYFIRMKHGSGAWNAYDDGTKRLLGFLNVSFPCEGEGRAIAAGEMRDKYMSKGALPSFLYLYCDDTFALSSTDVAVLTEYLGKGGFLFLDSRPDPVVRERVQNQVDKILPGARLSVITRSHPINTALFRLASPGIGENYIDQKNYGVSRGGRLVIFYTPGNFSHLYSMFPSGSNDYVNAQYQMGANVMLYAIMKGKVNDFEKKAGANAQVTKQALESLGLLDPGSKTGGPGDKQESVKVKKEQPPTPKGGKPPPDVAPETPDEINLKP